MLLLDDLQLDETETDSARYKAIAGVKKELEGAQEMIDCRLDMIEKADSSKVGWSAAVYYEKSNGSVKKENSDKLWVEAEKSVQEAKKAEKTPFRSRPAQAGKNSFTRKGKFPEKEALLFLLCFVLCSSVCSCENFF